ncbi:hypothetical protein [Natronorubrum texcoconense]|uniref:Uncharacterized protein n=1 Tax=Natronorubrum texcoconense TaxID=1095776 RepID=A0A1G8X8B1_9EURY|nr:hypothetical protein [Natronorubrum texcoconense]SDJ85980.1 hypothetical protein SAMN04515672_1631 [Natronorubrum texcoconense]
MSFTLLGFGLVALGLAGVRYAPAIVAAQHRQGMAPLGDDDGADLENADRVRVTKGAGVVLVVVGLVSVAYGSGIV